MAADLNDGRRADARGWGPEWPRCDTSKWVELAGEGDESTPEQEKVIKRMVTVLDTLTDELGKREEGLPMGGDKASPAGAAKRVVKVVIEAEKA